MILKGGSKRKKPQKKEPEIIDLVDDPSAAEDDVDKIPYRPKNFDYKKELALLTAKRQTNPQDDFQYNLVCKVCLTNKISLILFPCRHACICQECIVQLPIPKLCPVCRSPIDHCIDVYLCD